MQVVYLGGYLKMKNKYEFGEDFELDVLKTNRNISKMLKGKTKRKGNVDKKFTAWKTA